MDYETKATNRKELRLYAKLFRSICGFTPNECIDPILLLDKLPDLEGFEDVRYEIVYGNELPNHLNDVFTSGKVEYSRITQKNGRPGYERLYSHNGKHYLLTGVGTNGYIVSAYPINKDVAIKLIERYK